MKYIINLKSDNINGVKHWNGGVAPVHPLGGQPNRAIAVSESVATEHKSNITDEIQRRLNNEDFIANEITHGNVRVGSLDELMDLLEQVE